MPHPEPASRAWRGFGLVLAAALTFALYNIILKVILTEKTIFGLFKIGGLLVPSLGNSLLLLWIRALVVVPGIALVATVLYPKVWQDVSQFSTLQDRTLVSSLLQSGFGLFLSQILMYRALWQIPANIAVALFFTHPITTLLLVWFHFGERPTRFRIGVMAIILLGAICTILSGGTISPQNSLVAGSLGATGSGIAFAFYLVRIQASTQRMNPVSVSFILFAIVFVLASFSLLLPWQDSMAIKVAPANSLALVVGGSLLGIVTLIAYLCQNSGIRIVGASLASIIGATGPAATAILAWIVIGETLFPLKVIGILLVTTGAIALSLERRHSQAQTVRR